MSRSNGSRKPKTDQFKLESDTPMTDLYLGKFGLTFAASWEGEVYHGYEYNPTADRKDSRCERDFQGWHLCGAVTAYSEEDISPVRRPCKLCLAALHKSKKEASK